MTTNFGLWQIRVTAALVAVGFGLLIVFWRNLPPQVPLFYNRAWGVDQLAQPIWLWLLPSLTLSIGAAAYWMVHRIIKDKVLLATVVLSTIAMQAIITLALIRIVVLVI